MVASALLGPSIILRPSFQAHVATELFPIQAWNSRKGDIVELEVRSVFARARARGTKEILG